MRDNSIQQTSSTSTPTPRQRRKAISRKRGSIRQASGNTPTIVNGTKSMTGHLLGGAGAGVSTLLALRHRKVPPTINLDNCEPDLGIDIATKVRDLPTGDVAGINNSFGFGGHNVAVAAPTPTPEIDK